MTRPGGRAGPAALAALALAVIAGCGGGGGGSSSTTATATTTTAPPARETVDRLGHLPEGWTRFESPRGGFALGVPRGWDAERRGRNALIRSYDRLVALSISPNRSLRAQQVPLEEFATRTASALNGFQSPVQPGRPHPLDHRYDGVQVRAAATEKSGLRERLRVVVLRRRQLVTFTAVIAANAKRDSEPAEDLALKVLHTLRSRPPESPGQDEDGENDRRESRGGAPDPASAYLSGLSG